MNWFSGPISDAIAESHSKKRIFLVYAYDSNSSDADSLWNDDEIAKKCSDNCVSIKLEAESLSCSQFKQLYPITCFPTTYLIGNIGGTPIRIISGNLDRVEFLNRIENAIEIHETQIKMLESSQTTVPIIQNVEPGTSRSNQPVEEPNSKKSESNEDEELAKKKKLDEKVAKAKERLRLIQDKKRIEEENKERNQEIERRKLGQEVLKAKKEKEDMELKRLAEQKRKEKLEDELAKKRVMERIQQDREEKQKKYAAEKVEIDKSKEAAEKKLELAKQQERMTEAANKSKVARIQFRLTDGSSVVNSFEPEQTLDDARMFITNKLKEMNESTSFTIHSTFPKRDYTTSDMSLTLRELQLVPSASLLIIPTSSKTVKALSTLLPSTSSVRNSGGSNSTTSTIVTYATDLLGFMFLPFTIIWGIVSNVLGLNSPHSNRRYENHTNSRQNESVDFEDQNSRRKNFRNGEDDDNATYNGNSTQQM